MVVFKWRGSGVMTAWRGDGVRVAVEKGRRGGSVSVICRWRGGGFAVKKVIALCNVEVAPSL